MSWNPEIYLGSEGHQYRVRPALDLIARVPVESLASIADIGCGAGDVTRFLAERWPGAKLTGVDNAPAMLERARRDVPQVSYQLCDVAEWRPEVKYDLVISNSALQWVSDHAQVLPQLLECVGPGGILAVQMPNSSAEPSHSAIRATVDAGPWRERLVPLLRARPVHDAQFYYRLLRPISKSVDIWETQYLHVLTGSDPIVQWTRPTALRPFLHALEGADRNAFEAEYRARVAEAYPPEPDGTTLYPFRRLFMLAWR